MTPIVFVHGFMGGSLQWAGQEHAFGPARVIALDLPGFGKNAAMEPMPTIQAYADWALAELSRSGVSQFHLVGHSMGGMIAQEMVARAPERIERLVLYGTGAKGVLPGRFETIETSKARALQDGAKATARRIAATWFLEKEDAPGFEDCAQIAECSEIKAVLAGLDAMAHWDGCRHLPKLDVETLIIWGDQDRTYSWGQTEHLWRGIEGANLAVIPSSAHASHIERQDVFNLLVAEFL